MFWASIRFRGVERFPGNEATRRKQPGTSFLTLRAASLAFSEGKIAVRLDVSLACMAAPPVVPGTVIVDAVGDFRAPPPAVGVAQVANMEYCAGGDAEGHGWEIGY